MTRKQRKHLELAIEQIAANHHTTADAVRKSIEELIEAALTDTDPNVQALWATCPREGDKPTPEEFLLWTAERVNDGL